MQTTAIELFRTTIQIHTLDYFKKPKLKHMKTIIMQKNLLYQTIIKETHILKIVFSVTKQKYENKRNFNIKSVDNHFVLGNVSKNHPIIFNKKKIFV